MSTGEACPFCEIVAGRAPATIVDQWDDVIIIVPLNPVVPGHVMLIPQQHVTDFVQDPAASRRVMEVAAVYVADHRVGDCNVITSRGAAATQTVGHLHLHVVPRVEGDGLHLPWTGQVTG